MQLKSYLTIAEKKMMRGKVGKKKLYFDSFDFGYCITVHKAQGSEYSKVLYIEEVLNRKNHHRMLYTAITRAKEKLIIMR